MQQDFRLSVSAEDKDKPKFDEWEIKNAVETLIKAEEIKKNSELMKLVAPKLQEQAKAAADAASILYKEREK